MAAKKKTASLGREGRRLDAFAAELRLLRATSEAAAFLGARGGTKTQRERTADERQAFASAGGLAAAANMTREERRARARRAAAGRRKKKNGK